MTGRTHDAFAFASLITVSSYFPPQSLNVITLTSSLIGNVIGALIPDMDQASNKLWDLLPEGNFVGRIFRKLFLAHRTLSHSILGVYIFYKILGWLLPKLLNSNYVDVGIVFAAIMIGYISHLIADALTKEGIPLFFPLPWKVGFPPFSFLRVTTDSWFEKFIVLPGIGVYLIWFINLNKNEVIKILSLVVK